MSWGISASGAVDDVRITVREASVNGQVQGELVKELVDKLLNGKVPGKEVYVNASGHHDANYSTLSVEVKSQ